VEEKDATDADRRAWQRIVRERKSPPPKLNFWLVVELVALFRRSGIDREENDPRDEPLFDVPPTEAIFCGKRKASAAVMGLVVKNNIVDNAMMVNAERTRDRVAVAVVVEKEEQTSLHCILSPSSSNISDAFCVHVVVCIFMFYYCLVVMVVAYGNPFGCATLHSLKIGLRMRLQCDKQESFTVEENN
jgi:hypothetical protein